MKRYFIERQEVLAQFKIVQTAYLLYALSKYVYFLYGKHDSFGAYAATLRYERIAASVAGWKPSALITRINARMIASIKERPGTNKLVESYVHTLAAIRWRKQFERYGWEHQVRLKYPQNEDDVSRQGDLLILKPYRGEREKGVLLIKYNEAFKKFVSNYHLDRVGAHYRIVLEPSFWGYRDASFFLFMNTGPETIVQAPYQEDFEYIQSLRSNLIPSRLGAGDWTDPDLFQVKQSDEKRYDIVMVASWLRLKRHELLFSALRQCGDAVKRVALIGYPWEGRTKEDIVQEAKRYGVDQKIDIYESIPRAEVSRIVGQSKIGVMLTLREGANKGIYECLFSGVPVIVSDHNRGVNSDHINSFTGLIAEDQLLPQKITYLLSHLDRFAPREWAVKTTGYKNATRMLNAALKQYAQKHQEEWTRDIFAKKNDPNPRYANDRDRLEANQAMADMRAFLRT